MWLSSYNPYSVWCGKDRPGGFDSVGNQCAQILRQYGYTTLAAASDPWCAPLILRHIVLTYMEDMSNFIYVFI